MNPLLRQFLRRRGITHIPPGSEQSHQFYTHVRAFRLSAWRWTKDIIFLLLGVASAAFGLESFLLPNEFIDGGVTGISLLVAEVTGFPLPILIALLNLPFVLIGWRMLGTPFAIKTTLAVAALAVVISTVHFPEVTQDKLLVAIFGGFFLGAGIGLAIRAGAVLDGTEVLAIFLNRRIKVTIGDVILVVNILIFGVAAWLLSVEQALYSMITYLAASKTVNFVVDGIEEYTALTIISGRSAEMRQVLVEELGRGVTVFKGKGGYGKKGESGSEQEILYTVATKIELGKIFTEIERVDPDAFVITTSVKDVSGGLVKRRPLKH